MKLTSNCFLRQASFMVIRGARGLFSECRRGHTSHELAWTLGASLNFPSGMGTPENGRERFNGHSWPVRGIARRDLYGADFFVGAVGAVGPSCRCE